MKELIKKSIRYFDFGEFELLKLKIEKNLISIIFGFLILAFFLIQVYYYYYNDDYYEELFETTYCSVIEDSIYIKKDSINELAILLNESEDKIIQTAFITPFVSIFKLNETNELKIPENNLNIKPTATINNKSTYTEKKSNYPIENLMAQLLQGVDTEEVLNQSKPSYLPVEEKFSSIGSNFGTRKHPILNVSRLHEGVDFDTPYGANVYAAGTGIVTKAGWLKGYGKLICIQHLEQTETRYGHLSQIKVKEGQIVNKGDLIGKVGSTGMSTKPHLHYEVRVNGKPKNPTQFYKK